MLCFNRFVAIVERNLNSRGLSHEQKHRVLQKIIKDTKSIGIFSFPMDGEDQREGTPILDINVRVQQKQIELGIEPDIEITEEELRKHLGEPYGQTRLHQAVLLGDKEAILRYIGEGDKPSVRDNNHNTPLDIAIAEEDQDIINLFNKLEIFN